MRIRLNGRHGRRIYIPLWALVFLGPLMAMMWVLVMLIKGGCIVAWKVTEWAVPALGRASVALGRMVAAKVQAHRAGAVTGQPQSQARPSRKQALAARTAPLRGDWAAWVREGPGGAVICRMLARAKP